MVIHATDNQTIDHTANATASLFQQGPTPANDTPAIDSFSESLRDHCAFSVKPEPMPKWKRTVDITFCLAALPVFALVSLGMAIVTKITSPGPILFTQERIGFRSRRFKCYKFRTMIVDADARSHQQHCDNIIHSNAPMIKLDTQRDPRLIPGAWLIRASGIDELPQLINIIKGDMSLIGPRPCVPYEYAKFTRCQRARFNALPGLTGLWQVSGKNRTTYEQMLNLDVQYTKTLSWRTDLKIILLTAPTLFGQIFNTYRARKILSHHSPESLAAVETVPTSSASSLADPTPITT